jgi:hypothetical protein
VGRPIPRCADSLWRQRRLRGRQRLVRASLLTLHQTLENTSSFPKIHLKRSHVNLGIDDCHGHSIIHANRAEEAGFVVASSGAVKFRKSFSDQGFTVFDRGNFGLVGPNQAGRWAKRIPVSLLGISPNCPLSRHLPATICEFAPHSFSISSTYWPDSLEHAPSLSAKSALGAPVPCRRYRKVRRRRSTSRDGRYFSVQWVSSTPCLSSVSAERI